MKKFVSTVSLACVFASAAPHTSMGGRSLLDATICRPRDSDPGTPDDWFMLAVVFTIPFVVAAICGVITHYQDRKRIVPAMSKPFCE